MRIPFLERVPINRVAMFTVVLFIAQRLEGTPLYFSVGCSVFILVAAFAFNAAGGLTRISGRLCLFLPVLVFIVGICYKAILGEPAQTNLLAPRSDIEAYVGSIVGLYAAVIISRRFSRKPPCSKICLQNQKMFRASVGCIVFGIAGVPHRSVGK